MRQFFVVASLAAALVSAQSPLMMPFTANNSGAAGWQVFFDLNVIAPSGLTITGLDVNCGTTAVGTVGAIELYVGPATYVGELMDPSQWTLAVHGGVIAQGNDVPAFSCLGAGVFLPPGPHAISVRHLGVGVGFTNGTSTNLTGATSELQLTAGAATSAYFSGSSFSPRVWNGNIHYHVGNVPGTGCAQSEVVGTGCYRGTTSFYESFPSLAACDFVGGVGSEVVLYVIAQQPYGYVVVPWGPSWFTPIGPPVLDNAPLAAPMGDTTFSQPLVLPFTFPFPGGNTNVIHAASDGYIVLGSTTSNACDASPTASELLAQSPRLCPLWCNLQPETNLPTNPLSGIYFDVDTVDQVAYVTWLEVADRSVTVPAPGATSVSIQLALHASGSFEFRYRGIVPNATSAPVLVGASKGRADGFVAVDPGSVDLSASLPLQTTGPDRRPLVHSVGLPRIGTSLDLVVGDVENLVPLAFLFFGDGAIPSGAPLASLGAPGCAAYTSANLGAVTMPVSTPAGAGAVALPIPNSLALVGAQVTSQAAAFTLQNPLGLVTSNGVTWTVGH